MDDDVVETSSTLSASSAFVSSLLALLLAVVWYYYYYYYYYFDRSHAAKTTRTRSISTSTGSKGRGRGEPGENSDDETDDTYDGDDVIVDDDPYYAIEPCPNPNCVRCQKYAAVNRQALRKLPWLQKQHMHQQQQHQQQPNATAITTTSTTCSSSIDRVVAGVTLGRRQCRKSSHDNDSDSNDDDDVSRRDVQSPVRGQYPTVLLVPKLIARPNVTHFHIATCRFLEQRVDLLRDEYQHVVSTMSTRQEPMPWLENDASSSSSSTSTTAPHTPWTVLHLMNQGKWIKENVQLFPQTFQIMTELLPPPNSNGSSSSSSSSTIMKSCIFGNIFLSRVRPGCEIAPHCGPTNVRHRLHLTLINTTNTSSSSRQQQPVLKVRDEIMTWARNQALVFDDSLVHSVAYIHPTLDNISTVSSSTPTTTTTTTTTSRIQSTTENINEHAAAAAAKGGEEEEEERIVWIVDLWHPDLTPSERQAITDLYPAS
jgi:hypothetical protein